MISIIIATRNADLLGQITANIKKSIGVDHEIIAINGNNQDKGICRIYNEGATRAKFPFLCFIHEDLLFHTDNWGQNLIKHLKNEDVALVGVLGSLIKTKTPSGVYIPVQKLTRVNQLQRKKNGETDQYYENPGNDIRSEVKLLDGMFLAITKSNHAKYNFDEQLLTGFHGYDVDYSLGHASNGKIVVVYDILLEHFSYGGNTVSWIDAQLKITKKWLSKLPQHIMLSKQDILTAEIVNTSTFLMTLYNDSYKKKIQFKYLCSLLKLRKLSFENLYFIRRFFIYGAFENGIKSILGKH
jgi:hypothetical protein